MNDLRTLFIETCENYKNIVDIFDHLNDIIDGDVWNTRMGAEVVNLFTITMEFIYKSRYPDEDIYSIGLHYDDFLDSIFTLIVNGCIEVSIKGKEHCIETFENLWRFWFETEDTFVIKNI